MVEDDTLEEIQLRLSESAPFELLEKHVVAEIDAQVCARCNRPASMLELLFVEIDRHIGVYEVLEASSMVEVEMADDDGLDVFDVIPSSLDGIG